MDTATIPDLWGQLGIRLAEQLQGYDALEACACAQTPEELRDRLSITRAQARKLWAAVSLHRAIANRKQCERERLDHPEKVAEIMQPLLGDLPHEELWMLALDVRSRLIKAVRISQGDVDGTDAGPRAVLRAALKLCATSFCVVHNHPAGDPTPSQADLRVTERLVAAGKATDCPLVDHIVITRTAFHSMRRETPQQFR